MQTLKKIFCGCFKKSKDQNKIEGQGSGYVQLSGADGEELATFGAGCYWGTEKYFTVNFQHMYPGAILG